jgi:hypothetical protein
MLFWPWEDFVTEAGGEGGEIPARFWGQRKEDLVAVKDRLLAEAIGLLLFGPRWIEVMVMDSQAIRAVLDFVQLKTGEGLLKFDDAGIDLGPVFEVCPPHAWDTIPSVKN